jgi:hypothetical protein
MKRWALAASLVAAWAHEVQLACAIEAPYLAAVAAFADIGRYPEFRGAARTAEIHGREKKGADSFSAFGWA